jgi:DNA-binding winged helix-turn-helix (wHTH) protein
MKWRIGEWVACSDSDTLKTDGANRKVERRAMEALVVLAERAGEVVKKDELIAAVWGRVAVSDHSVAMVVSQLRRALNDDARAPRYIETITKRGYRLIAPCEPMCEAAGEAVAARRAPISGVVGGALSLVDPRALTFISGAAVLAGISALSMLLLWPA